MDNEICSTETLNCFEVDKKSGKTSHNFIPEGRKNIQGDFLFVDRGESSMLISRIGTQRFSCSGTCYCEEDRRMSAVKPVTCFLAASSAAVAMVMGNKYLQNQCKELFEHTCKSVSVDDFRCSDGVGDDSTSMEDDDENDDDLEEHTFNCFGKCIDPDSSSQDVLENLKCGGRTQYKPMFDEFSYTVSQQDKYRKVRKDFVVDHMNDYCSQFSFVDPSSGEELRCRGSYDGVRSDQIDCEQIDPPPNEAVCRIS